MTFPPPQPGRLIFSVTSMGFAICCAIASPVATFGDPAGAELQQITAPHSRAAKDSPIRVPQVAVLRDLCSSTTRKHRSAGTPTCGTKIRHFQAAYESDHF